jgi:hypothetical protein
MRRFFTTRGNSAALGVTLLVACLAAPVAMVGAEGLDAKEILRRTDEAEGYRSQFAEMRQTITTSGGQKRTLVIRAWAVDNGDKQLAEYLAPADIKGQKILMTEQGDNIWMFNPETRRTRKLGSHMRKRKVMGSDFTYEDQAGGRISEKYVGKLLGEEEEGGVLCYRLELTPTPKGPSYGKVVAWIAKSDFVGRRVDFYEEGATQPFKRMIVEDVRAVGAKQVPHKLTMTNLEDRTDTVSVVTRVRFGVKLADSIFESRNLER